MTAPGPATRAASRAALTELASDIFCAGLAAVDPYAAVMRCVVRDGDQLTVAAPGHGDIAGPVQRYDLGAFRRVLLLGAGKAACAMGRAVEQILDGRAPADGLLVLPNGQVCAGLATRVTAASHPVPDEAGLRAGRALLALAQSAGPDDLVIVALSGGASALLAVPATGVSLADKQALTQALLASGASVDELNTVRKHVSALKGGQLARAAAKATVLTLLMSDVVGDDPSVIASGPTAPDASSFDDARQVLARHGLWATVPAAIRARLGAGCRGAIAANPGPDDPQFLRMRHVVVGSNRLALEACARAAAARGITPRVISSTVQGESRDVGRAHGALLCAVCTTGEPLAPPLCLILGGETTVTLALGSHGRGGRNQELALAAAFEIRGLDGACVLSAGTDGVDGPTDAAGAMVFGDTVDPTRTVAASIRGRLSTATTPIRSSPPSMIWCTPVPPAPT